MHRGHTQVSDVAEVLIEGPWRHRFVAANGARFHVAEADPDDVPPSTLPNSTPAAPPLVVLLHGFPQFWWAWRHQLPALAAAGYRAAAMDLRGYGASDKPPRGYDTATLAADVAGVVRALGASEAVIVGHDWGAWLAWAMPTLHPTVTTAIGVFSMGHPLTMRGLMARGRQRTTLARALAYQTPFVPERRLVRGNSVEALLNDWWGAGCPDPDDVARYRSAMRLPSVAPMSMEYFRRAVRPVGRGGQRGPTVDALHRPVEVPVLQLHGARDPWVTPDAADASRRRVTGPLTSGVLPDAGHFLPEEAPDQVTAALLDWLDTLR